MKTSIIIWTYNQRESTQNCLESIRKYTESGQYELIVVDNHSTDGTTEWLKNQPDVKVLSNEGNPDFPQGYNRGIEAAAGDNILLLENNVVVTHCWLNNLIEGLYGTEEIGAVGPVTNRCAGRQAIRVDYKSLEEMQSYAERHNSSNSRRQEEALKLAGFCLLIKKQAVDKTGLLDEEFTAGGFWAEDYSFRLRLSGYKLLICPQAFVHHFAGNPASNNESRPNNRDKFRAKWGFDLTYSTFIRHDLIALIDKPRDIPFTVLEIGCACGSTLLQIKNIFNRAEIYGIEYNEQAALVANSLFPVIAADIEKTPLPYPGEFFDYIILGDVLEHLVDPWQVLEKIRPYLKFDGYLLASIPNVMHFSVLRGLLRGNWTYEAAGLLDKTHLRFFTLNEIKKMFTGAGYKVSCCQPVRIYETVEDQKFIEALAGFTGDRHLAAQYRAYQYIVKAFNPAAVAPIPRLSPHLRADKICFITCVNDEGSYRQCLSNIRGLEVPDGYEVEVLALKDSVSPAAAYNTALRQSDAKYKVYLHQDVAIINKQFIQDVLNIFKNPRLGMIGVVGSGHIPASGIWWESSCNYGKVHDSHTGTMGLVAFQEVEDDYQEVECIDGLIMITQYDLPWREDIFTGWHFYDLAQSREFIRHGCRIVVPRQNQPWCKHDCGVMNLSKDYESARQLFVKEGRQKDV